MLTYPTSEEQLALSHILFWKTDTLALSVTLDYFTSLYEIADLPFI